MTNEELVIKFDGTINIIVPFEPEVIGLIRKYKALKDTKDIPVETTINNIIKDYLMEMLSKPTGFKVAKTLDRFAAEVGK